MLDQLGLAHPTIQAPMAGVSTPALAAAVSQAGALGSIGIVATDTTGAREMMFEVRSRTERAFNVNVFVHRSPQRSSEREGAWLSGLAPTFAAFDAQPPSALDVIYKSFVDDDDTLSLLREVRPAVVIFILGCLNLTEYACLRMPVAS